MEMQVKQSTKPQPMRQCLGCNCRKPKRELIRVVRLPDGGVVLDRVGKVSGRGAYVCPDEACLKRARKSKRIEHILECEISETLYDSMEAEIRENKEK